mmetsp:Transcript_17672/g.49291  ORF Transcript_17672/g.49291 Transcript_17672/m.49291 type:complete len:174 (-) Transcript_17672:1497-2018(-)
MQQPERHPTLPPSLVQIQLSALLSLVHFFLFGAAHIHGILMYNAPALPGLQCIQRSTQLDTTRLDTDTMNANTTTNTNSRNTTQYCAHQRPPAQAKHHKRRSHAPHSTPSHKLDPPLPQHSHTTAQHQPGSFATHVHPAECPCAPHELGVPGFWGGHLHAAGCPRPLLTDNRY